MAQCLRSPWLVTLFAAALVGGTPPADAAPSPSAKPFGESVLPLRTDTARYVAYQPSATQTRVVDTQGNPRRLLTTGTGCRLEDGAAAYFLLNCTQQGGLVPYVLRARQGSTTPAAGLGQTYLPMVDQFSGIGSQWLVGENSETGHAVVEYLNWHTGLVKTFGEADADPVVPRDLNSANLRALGPAQSVELFLRLPRFTVSLRRSTGHAPLLLKRGRKTIGLDRCSTVCNSVSASPQLVTWATRFAAHAYVVSTGKRFNWTFNKRIALNLPDLTTGIQQTGRWLFFNVPRRDGTAAAGFRVLRAKNPA
jgi:hypothetical protein